MEVPLHWILLFTLTYSDKSQSSLKKKKVKNKVLTHVFERSNPDIIFFRFACWKGWWILDWFERLGHWSGFCRNAKIARKTAWIFKKVKTWIFIDDLVEMSQWPHQSTPGFFVWWPFKLVFNQNVAAEFPVSFLC